MAGSGVAVRLEQVRQRIAAACAKAGRQPQDVRLVAVSKRIALPLVAEACAAGQWDLGENRIQDALQRMDALPDLLERLGLDAGQVRWHFIGHLQRNKARKAGGRFALLHGVDSLELGRRLSDLAVVRQHREAVLLEVNISGEPQKNGVAPQDAVALAADLAALPGLSLQGMMGMASFGDDEVGQRRSFALLRELNEQARAGTGLELPVLSMGMSGDFEAAIAEGSTLVRIGTAIFGPRG